MQNLGRKESQEPIRFIRYEEHTVENVGLATSNVIRFLNKPGRSNMLEAIARMLREDPLDSPTRMMLAEWLEIIAAREQKSLVT